MSRGYTEDADGIGVGTAANTGDVATLKPLNSMMWAILALIFAGFLPGIMLILSFGTINELGQAPPPPPPS